MSGGAPIKPSKMELQKVHNVQFEIFKEKQIKDHAVCLVEVAKSYERGRPVKGGINDLRMGSTDFDFACETCHCKHPECPGHFGYMELAEPMFNIGVFHIVLHVLKCVCKTCGALLLNPENVDSLKRLSGLNRLRAAMKFCGNKCRAPTGLESGGIVNAAESQFAFPDHGCGASQPKIGRVLTIYPGLVVKATTEDQDELWYANTVRQIFDKITDEDARVLGFHPERCHPRDLLLTVLPVPPPQVRPAVAFGSAKSDDELTHQILTIVKRNNELRRDKESGMQTAIDHSRLLVQEYVATYFHNGSTLFKPIKVNDTKQLKSLTERLKGKYGRLRGNLMGKRVDFSSRTVITGDPNIDVDEVGVPFSIAMTLTFPERVNAINKKRLTEFVRRTAYPSANYIYHPNGTVTKLALLKDRGAKTLNIGDVVERHVINGDVVLFNRQPTLHRMSMMGHRVRVLNYNTFRLNLSCTTPYNADFDGDEMNMHVPQSLLTKAELMEIMMVPKNFVSPNKSAPCMGIVQDSLLGSYRLTDKETFLDKFFVQSVAIWIDRWNLPIPAILKPRALWTGKQIFSLILPEVNHPVADVGKAPFPHNDTSVLIRRGQLLCGCIKKGVVGAAPGSLIHVIFNEKGSDEVAKFINGVQRITAFFLLNASFSVGVQDTVADEDTLRQMNEVLQGTRKSVEKFGAAANNRTLQRKAGMTLLQSFEADVNGALNQCREEAARKALKNVRRTNSFKVMIEAGSKGTDLNICQIAVFVGQQNVNGARIPFGFRRRTLPHFMLDDYGETSRGMANRGYVEGLKPHEFFFHTMAGREGLIDTAVKTSDTGYLQRKLIKALEDAHAAYDGTVRNASQELIQFMYGEDGLDGARIEGNQTFKLPFMGNHDMEKTFKYEYNDKRAFQNDLGGTYMRHDVKRMLRADPDNVKKLQGEFEQLMADRDGCRVMLDMDTATKLNLPVNIERLIQNARSTMGERSEVSNLNPVTVIEKVQKLQEDLVQLFPSYNKDFNSQFRHELSRQRIESALALFKVHLRQMLGSKRVLSEYKLNDKAFTFLLSEIRTKYMQSLIHPGEMIGAIAAQSCGEPATQMTLNTFHNAGISSKNVTLGVPRLLELLNVSKNQKHASMLIWLSSSYSSDRKKAQRAQHLVEYCSLDSITRRIQFIYDPDAKTSCVQEDADTLALQWDVMELEDQAERVQQIENGSPWVVRLEFDHEIWGDKLLTTKNLKDAIRRVAGDKYLLDTDTDDVQRQCVLRLRPVNNERENSIGILKHEIPQLLSQVHLRGIPGVKKALLKDMNTYPIEEGTGNMSTVRVCTIDTDGTALRQVFSGMIDETGENIVNYVKTSSNKIPEVNSLLGIEAARIKLLMELREAYLAYGLNINYRHYTMLVDIMCQRGYLMAISRVGINRSDLCGPLMRCSFEETVNVLMHAAAFGEKDPVRGVSANIILGNQSRVGTGIFDVMLHMGELQNAVPQAQAVAAGKEVNVYHGLASIQTESTVAPPYPTGRATPLANDMSAVYRAGASASGSGSLVSAAASNLYAGTTAGQFLQATPQHYSELHPDMADDMMGTFSEYYGSTGSHAGASSAYPFHSADMPSSAQHYAATIYGSETYTSNPLMDRGDTGSSLMYLQSSSAAYDPPGGGLGVTDGAEEAVDSAGPRSLQAMTPSPAYGVFGHYSPEGTGLPATAMRLAGEGAAGGSGVHHTVTHPYQPTTASGAQQPRTEGVVQSASYVPLSSASYNPYEDEQPEQGQQAPSRAGEELGDDEFVADS